MMNDVIASLQKQYLDLINHQLPLKAQQTSMPVRFNHCFARIVLDNLFNDCWYNHLSRQRPAYQQLNETQLKGAITIARAMLRQPKNVERLNKKSLRWRGKLRCG
jgi:hypothetical protein